MVLLCQLFSVSRYFIVSIFNLRARKIYSRTADRKARTNGYLILLLEMQLCSLKNKENLLKAKNIF